MYFFTMARLLFIALLGLSSLLTSFRSFGPGPNPVRETRVLPDFTRIALVARATVYVHHGSVQQVVVEGAAKDLASLYTTVKNGQLVIHDPAADHWKAGWKRGKLRTPRGPIQVQVTVPIIEGLAVRSSGQLLADRVRAERLTLGVSGSGRLQTRAVHATQVRTRVTGSGQLIIAQLAADTLSLSTTGSGRLTVAGACPRLRISVRGSGRVQAAGLTTETCQARLSGSGSCRVQVSQQLDARIRGSGNIVVTGTAQINSYRSGSGRVRRG